MPAAAEVFENAKFAIKQKDYVKARDLLTQLIKQDRDNADYWLWMSAAVDTKKERVFCLKEVLRLDPESRGAKFGLQLAGEREFDPSLIIPLENQTHNWEKRFIRPAQPKVSPVKLIGQIATFVVVIGALIGAGYLLLINTVGQKSANRGYQSIVGATATASLTPSPGPGTPHPTLAGPQPLWMQLKATYTPTPLYVSTPHSLLEAYSAGIRAYMRNDWQSVINYFQQVVSADPNALDGYYLIGEAYRFMGDDTKALQAYNESLTRNNGFAPSYLARARVHITENPNDWQSAQDDLLHAVQLDPNMGEAYLELTALEIEHGTTIKAQLYVNSAASLLPGSPLVTYYQSQLDFLNGYTSKAYTEVIQSKSQDITYLPTYRLLGEILQSQGKLAESLAPLQTYLLYVNQDMPAWVMVGKAYAAKGELDNALMAYNLAIENGLRNYDLWLARAGLYIAKGDGQSAYNDYSKALAIDDTSFEATLGIGKAYLLLKQYGIAYNQISRAEGMVKTPEQKAAIYYYRAQSLEGLMSRNEAKDYMVIKEWKSLLALPASGMPQSWRDTATQHISLLQTPTPSPSATRTSTKPSATATATPTHTKPVTPSPTHATATPSPTP
jgi:tetratricopeptide (TPR) repeat protein